MSAQQSSPRQPPRFDTASGGPEDASKDEVESPSVSAPHALARFEFESGRGNEGTKILMVEWDDDPQTSEMSGEWHVTWEGMRTVLPATGKDTTKEADGLAPGAKTAGDDTADGATKTIVEKGGSHRMYFLLQPGTAVPPIVTLTYKPSNAAEIVWNTNPLPAIFPPELGASARTAGKKGVLHTIWAKQRLRTLRREIEEESKLNVESVGLTMAVQESEWIEENFGVASKPSVSEGSDAPRSPGPSSPRSPGGSRLQQKLQGLRLGTSNEALTSSRKEAGAGLSDEQHPLSPETGDVAISSFAAIKGNRGTPFDSLSSLAAQPAQKPAATSAQPARRVAAAQPPAAILREQQNVSSFGGFQSMGAPAASVQGGNDDEDLFAMPISPRSPEMSKSPFTFAREQGVAGKTS